VTDTRTTPRHTAERLSTPMKHALEWLPGIGERTYFGVIDLDDPRLTTLQALAKRGLVEIKERKNRDPVVSVTATGRAVRNYLEAKPAKAR